MRNKIIPVMLLCFLSATAAAVDHRVKVKIDRREVVVPADAKLDRAMLGMVRAPDGTIWLNTQTQQVLLKSTDEGRTWTTLPVKLPEAPPMQLFHGLGVSRDGRLWLFHQSKATAEDARFSTNLFVSVSSQGASSWQTTSIDFAGLAPGAPERPYALCCNDYNTFFQRPDGTMAVGVGLRYEDWKDYQQTDQTRPGLHETLVRSTDGGKTWGDPTEVHQHVAETCYQVDPNDPDHILAMTRKQRMPLRGETSEILKEKLGVPPPNPTWPFKGAILLESTDGGRSFLEVPGSYLGYYSHRGTLLWTKSNVLVASHLGAGTTDWSLEVNISMDGGKTWVDGSKSGVNTLNQAKAFVLVPSPPGFSFTSATVELQPNHFMTVYVSTPGTTVHSVFWHLEDL